MFDSQISVIPGSRASVGEGAWWDAHRQCLWSVDIRGRVIMRSDRQSTAIACRTPGLACAVATAQNDHLVVALDDALYLWHPERDHGPRRWTAPSDHPDTYRFNDMTIDPAGRIIIGTMQRSELGPAPNGVVYSVERGRWRRLLDGFMTINGLAFSADGKRMFWSDSHPSVNRIWSASYDAGSGTLGDPQPFVEMRNYSGRPDGGACDSEGGYWTAAIGGGCLHRFGADGSLDKTLDMPVDHPTKPVFGGADLRTMFVTSLSVLPSTDPARAAIAGAVLRIEGPGRGFGLANAVTG